MSKPGFYLPPALDYSVTLGDLIRRDAELCQMQEHTGPFDDDGLCFNCMEYPAILHVPGHRRDDPTYR